MKLVSPRWSLFGLFCMMGLGGCESDPNTAFPTAHAIAARVGREEGADIATLERGRKIYTTSCTECHVARTIVNYSVPQWRHFINIMAPRAGLQANDRAALEAYVIAARKSLSGGAVSNPGESQGRAGTL